uniref:Glutaredoxin domain-containing protein n=1 Tax=Hyaloperonospora arabidopsidis (strain Emoy2) TaxID=559515 RepID=M4BAI2_HYAAE
MVSAKESVEAQVAAAPVGVYSKTYCPHSTATKMLLTQLGVRYKVVELDQIPDGSEQQHALEQLTEQKTVPNVFVWGKSIGGNADVQDLHKDGKLEPLLKQHGGL